MRDIRKGKPVKLASLFVAFLLFAFITTCQSLMPRRIHAYKALSLKPIVPSNLLLNQLKVRGGSDVDEDDDDGEESDNSVVSEEVEGDGGSNVMGTVNSITKQFVVVLGKAMIAGTKASARALKAAFHGDDMEEADEEEPPTMMTRAVRTVKRMWVAAWDTSDKEDEPEASAELASAVRKKSHVVTVSAQDEKMSAPDFGSYLEDAFSVVVDRGDEPTTVMGGTIGDALREARSKARLLVVFIPSARPGRGEKKTPDHEAIVSLLSPEVSEVAEKRARKKHDSGSFVLWSAKASSPEAVTAIKRLKAKQSSSKGDKRPVLVVAYPAQVVDSRGVPKLVPRLLAQHHCSPPPSPELMAAWLNALRKRHAKQYAAMQHDLKEAQLFKERTEGYKSSVVSDIQRREREKIEEEERIARELAAKERVEMLERRREELRASLPDEPGQNVADAMTIALRFPDGRAGQRRFTPDTSLGAIFNWVDSGFEMEREQVVLSTMNGQKSFTYEEASETPLADSGLGRMTGLRVTMKKVETTNDSAE